MKKRDILIALAFIGAASSIEGARASQTFREGFDIGDLFSPSQSDGSITVTGYFLVAIALEELKKYPVSLEKHRSIHVWQTDRYYYVDFSPNELHSTMHGRLPTDQMGIEVQIERKSHEGSEFPS
ncbi:hypothetical protein [Taklimakanibacter lacteus]|uniref:hypothetical protein n=1 Tax=Taklimakanibacter lacteus TaxID=2268456 RepID=UPI000E66FD93